VTFMMGEERYYILSALQSLLHFHASQTLVLIFTNVKTGTQRSLSLVRSRTCVLSQASLTCIKIPTLPLRSETLGCLLDSSGFYFPH
jgi:hypothetical protein